MDKKTVKEIALTNGFKLKEQPDGSLELNPYVYLFADKLVDHHQAKVDELQTLYTQQGINMLKLQKRVDVLSKRLSGATGLVVEDLEQALKGL